MLDWTQVAMAAIVGLPAIIAALQGWRNSRKLDTNTKLTQEGTAAAVTNASAAKEAASDAKEAASDAKDATQLLSKNIEKKLNGDLDARIEAAVAAGCQLVLETLKAHTDQDEMNMLEIRNYLVAKHKETL